MSSEAPVVQTPLAGWPHEESPFHAGEQAMQARVGMRERMERIGRRVIRDFMPDQHRELFEQLPFVIVGSLDEHRRPWASILTGSPGFMTSPDPRTLRIDAIAIKGDPLRANLKADIPIALLGIQLETRRRNRMNGTVTELHSHGFVVRVAQSFGNCPQYIQAREPRFVSHSAEESVHEPVTGGVLSDQLASVVRSADTFFIATASPRARGGEAVEGVDVSHRGGKPGFVRVRLVDGRTELTVPDFRGNSHFNTLGNLALNPRAGLLFVDFDSGSVLSLTGEAEVIWDSAELVPFQGAERLVRFWLEEGVWVANALPLRWSEAQLARQLAATGVWGE